MNNLPTDQYFKETVQNLTKHIIFIFINHINTELFLNRLSTHKQVAMQGILYFVTHPSV